MAPLDYIRRLALSCSVWFVFVLSIDAEKKTSEKLSLRVSTEGAFT